MGIWGWFIENWFTLLSAAGIGGSLWYSAISGRAQMKTQQLTNLISMTQSHRELWRDFHRDLQLARVLDAAADVSSQPVTPGEQDFVVSVIQHLSSVYHAILIGLTIQPEGIQRDVCEFFSLPVPNSVWGKMKSDLTALKPQLVALSKRLEFDCFELAEILATPLQPPFLAHYTPVKAAGGELLARAARLQRWGHKMERSTIREIESAVQTGDLDFFYKLGNFLTDWKRPKPRKIEQETYNKLKLKGFLQMLWKPQGQWPGLAYCKSLARIEYVLNDLESKGYVTHSFTRKIGPKEFDKIRSRLGLKPAKKPFISQIEPQPDGTVRFL